MLTCLHDNTLAGKIKNKTKQNSPNIYSATATCGPSAALCTTATLSAHLAAAPFFFCYRTELFFTKQKHLKKVVF